MTLNIQEKIKLLAIFFPQEKHVGGDVQQKYGKEGKGSKAPLSPCQSLLFLVIASANSL